LRAQKGRGGLKVGIRCAVGRRYHGGPETLLGNETQLGEGENGKWLLVSPATSRRIQEELVESGRITSATTQTGKVTEEDLPSGGTPAGYQHQKSDP